MRAVRRPHHWRACQLGVALTVGELGLRVLAPGQGGAVAPGDVELTPAAECKGPAGQARASVAFYSQQPVSCPVPLVRTTLKWLVRVARARTEARGRTCELRVALLGPNSSPNPDPNPNPNPNVSAQGVT